jgi:hypothetical protein
MKCNGLQDNRPFNPEDPVIISETEIYCSTDCYAIVVLREENLNE